MLLMTADYARARNEKAERTRNWLIGNMRVKPFTTPKITAIDAAAIAKSTGKAAPRRRTAKQAEPA